MSDIVERLRNRNTPYGTLELMDKAADEIERLRQKASEWQGMYNAMLRKDIEIKCLRAEVEALRTGQWSTGP